MVVKCHVNTKKQNRIHTHSIEPIDKTVSRRICRVKASSGVVGIPIANGQLLSSFSFACFHGLMSVAVKILISSKKSVTHGTRQLASGLSVWSERFCTFKKTVPSIIMLFSSLQCELSFMNFMSAFLFWKSGRFRAKKKSNEHKKRN